MKTRTYAKLIRSLGGSVFEWFRALGLKSGGPWFKSSTLLLSGFVLGSPEFSTRPRCVNSQLASLLPVGIHNSLCYYIPHKWIALFTHAYWLARRWLAKYYSPLKKAKAKKNKMAFVGIFTNKVTLWAASYSACVVYTKTIIHLSVAESDFAARQKSTTIHVHFGE